ncbi:hypothetical protein GCM10018952_58060 [Streptosporangium vulgare]
MISRRSLTGTGHPGRHEYSSRSRGTRETFAENSGGPVGVGDTVVDGPAVGVTAVGVTVVGSGAVGSGAATSVAGEDAEIGAEVAGGAAGAGWEAGWEAVVPHEAAARQPTVVASTARVRIVNLEPDTCRLLRKTDKSDKKSL